MIHPDNVMMIQKILLMNFQIFHKDDIVLSTQIIVYTLTYSYKLIARSVQNVISHGFHTTE